MNVKRIFALCLTLALLAFGSAFAEEKVTLASGGGKTLTLTTETPVTLTEDANAPEGFMFVTVSREGVCPVVLSAAPAEEGENPNLNDYSEEELEAFIESAANQFDAYTSQVYATPSGNRFAEIKGESVQTIVTIYDGWYFQLTQFCEEGATSEADDAFMKEILFGLWTE